jgi:hypothetical protein
MRLQAVEAVPGENLVDAKITLPNGDTYLRGATDPVADLVVDLTLTNRTPKASFNPEKVQVEKVARLSPEDIAALTQKTLKENLTAKQIEEEVAKKKTTETELLPPINKDSLGVSYTAPKLGSNDDIKFIITRLPEEGETVPADAKPVEVSVDIRTCYVGNSEVVPGSYVPAGETSQVYKLPVGKYYLVRDPGKYSIKAILPMIGDNQKPSGHVESNEETFRVLPFKIVDMKFEDLKRHWVEFERGIPAFDYMFYQVKTSGGWNQVYYLQRIPVRDDSHWEWTPLCTVKANGKVQIAQVGYKKVALVIPQQDGTAGFYTLDFHSIGPKVTAKTIALKDGVLPKLKVEGGAATVE